MDITNQFSMMEYTRTVTHNCYTVKFLHALPLQWAMDTRWQLQHLQGCFIDHLSQPSHSWKTLSYCAQHLKVDYTTIKLYLSAVWHYYIANGYGDVFVDMARLNLTLRGIRKIHTNPKRNRIPSTADTTMYRLVNKLQQGALGRYEDALLTSAVCMVFFGALRCSEFTEDCGVLLGDIAFIIKKNKKNKQTNKTNLDRKYLLLNLRVSKLTHTD